jgi:hypothetical protein
MMTIQRIGPDEVRRKECLFPSRTKLWIDPKLDQPIAKLLLRCFSLASFSILEYEMKIEPSYGLTPFLTTFCLMVLIVRIVRIVRLSELLANAAAPFHWSSPTPETDARNRRRGRRRAAPGAGALPVPSESDFKARCVRFYFFVLSRGGRFNSVATSRRRENE